MVEKVRLIHLCVFREIQQIVDIRVAVCEGREEKTVFRCADHPVLHAVFNRIVGHIVAETRFVEFYQADAAEDKFIDVIGSIVHIQIIRSASRYIVGTMDQNNIVVFRIEIIRHHLFIKFINQRFVLQLTVAEF